MRDGSGGGEAEGRPQGGGGVDHRRKVQQRNVQTDTRFFRPPGVLTTLFSIIG